MHLVAFTFLKSPANQTLAEWEIRVGGKKAQIVFLPYLESLQLLNSALPLILFGETVRPWNGCCLFKRFFCHSWLWFIIMLSTPNQKTNKCNTKHIMPYPLLIVLMQKFWKATSKIERERLADCKHGSWGADSLTEDAGLFLGRITISSQSRVAEAKECPGCWTGKVFEASLKDEELPIFTKTLFGSPKQIRHAFLVKILLLIINTIQYNTIKSRICFLTLHHQESSTDHLSSFIHIALHIKYAFFIIILSPACFKFIPCLN